MAGGASARTAPIDAAHPSSAPVFAVDMAMHSSTLTERRFSNARSSAWPAIISAVASPRAAAAAAPAALGLRSRTSVASVARASPTNRATQGPHNAQTVGR